MKHSRLLGVSLCLGFLFVLGIAGCQLWRPGAAPEDQASKPADANVVQIAQHSSCISCHGPMPGFVPAHNPLEITCVSCHLGDRTQKDKDLSHQGMIVVPGNLKDAHLSCACHMPTVERVRGSMMAHAPGIVAVDRFVFGEASTPDAGAESITRLGDSPADLHMKQMCASCHLSRIKTKPRPVYERSRGGGCVACHLQYPAGYKKTALNDTGSAEPLPLMTHPALVSRVSDDHCFGCHSRSGRISTNYEGWHETLLSPDEAKGKKGFRYLEDGRIFSQKPADIHYERGMACVDCHTSRELMGDGKEYVHEEDATEVRCVDCHLVGKAKTRSWSELDDESKRLIRRREGDAGEKRHYLISHRSGNAMVNAYLDQERQPVLKGKLSDKVYSLRSPKEICTRKIDGHSRLSCKSCHTSWAPQCISCHTHFNPAENTAQSAGEKTYPGRWVEYRAEFLAEPPTLGVRERTGTQGQDESLVEPFIPGMILSIGRSKKHIDLPQDADSLIDEETPFHRLFAPSVPHTISAKGRSCESCHKNPLALGYGRGKLRLFGDGQQAEWRFSPTYAKHERDGLPLDAWIGFLGERNDTVSTRIGARPFTVEEQKKILRVGACLECHPGDKEEFLPIYSDFKQSLERVSAKCLVP